MEWRSSVKVRVRSVPLVPVVALLSLELIVGAGVAVVFNASGLRVASVIAWVILVSALLVTSPLALSSVTVSERGVRVRLGVWASAFVPAGHVLGADAVRSTEKFGAHMHGSDLVINGVWVGASWPLLRIHCDAAYRARIRLWRRVYASSITVSVSPSDWDVITRASRALAASSTRNP